MDTPTPKLNASEISKSKARAAAQAALDDMFLSPKQTNRASSFALYTWAGLAVVSAAVAMTIGLVPGGYGSDPDVVASVSESLSDDLPQNANPETAKIEFPDLPAAAVVADADQKQLLKDRPDLDATKTAAIAPEDVAPPAVSSVVPNVGDEVLGVDIGGSNSIPMLAVRFKALQRRSPELFSGLSPLVNFSESQGELDARLIAGPFASAGQLADFCRSVRLQLTLDCKQTKYQGDPIKLGQ